MIQLRSYQIQAITKMRDLMRQGCKSICYQGATGSGKTALTAHMLHTAASRGHRSLFVVHRRELIKQSAEAFNKEGLKYGIISAGFAENRESLTQLASIQTLTRRLGRLRSPSLIVWDESHHIASDSWTKTYKAFPNSYHIGLTATPERLDGRGLGNYFQRLVSGPSVSELISQGYLSPYKLYAPSTISTEGIHIRMGDYEKHELEAVVDRPSITGDAVSHYKRLAAGKRAIVFAVSIQHSKNVVAKFNQEGIHAEHVDGETGKDARDRAIERFKNGDTQVLSNVELFSEGFDVPKMEVAILLRPTQSLGMYLQQIGRALRPCEGKIMAVILDHVGNCQCHGLPDSLRTWTLEGSDRSSRGNQEKGGSVKICPSCFAAQVSGRDQCAFCLFAFPITPREVPEKEGQLEEVDVSSLQKRHSRYEQGRSQTLDDLYRLGLSRGYKNPRAWAYYVFKGRQAKKLRRIA
jgi:DNA repair protein RadD